MSIATRYIDLCLQPMIDFYFNPTRRTITELNLCRKTSQCDQAINLAAAQAGFLQDIRQAKHTDRLIHWHGTGASEILFDG